MGRCQSGFCMPMVMHLLAKENQIPMEQVTKKGSGSNLLFGLLFMFIRLHRAARSTLP